MANFQINTITGKDSKRGTSFVGVTTVSSTGSMRIPSGPTEHRGGRGRGVFAGGYSPGYVNVMDKIEIATTGNASDFGDLTTAAQGQGGACSSSTRGLIMGGQNPATHSDIDYVTISSGGGASNFGSLTNTMQSCASLSNNTRGINGGGQFGSPANIKRNIIDFVTIATTGNASDFGSLTERRSHPGATCSSTRGIWAGGYLNPVGNRKTIDYITIASKGDAITFGELVSGRYGPNSGIISNGTRGFVAGGYIAPAYTNVIEQIVIATLGNSTDFGDLHVGASGAGNLYPGGCSSATRGIVGGGGTPSGKLDVIDYFTMSSAGNAVSFGALTDSRSLVSAFSDSHGGLG